MRKSHDDPEPFDPIEQKRIERERNEVARERSIRRTHPGGEPSDPPEADDPSWPPKPVPGVGAPSVPAGGPSFGRGFYHLGGAAGGLSKRVAMMLALWGTFSTVVTTAVVYALSDRMVTVNRYAKDEADRREASAAQVRETDALRMVVNDLRVKIAALEGATRMMQQDPILPEKKRR